MYSDAGWMQNINFGRDNDAAFCNARHIYWYLPVVRISVRNLKVMLYERNDINCIEIFVHRG